MTTSTEAGTLLVVGVGASAGGLGAFSEVLSHLPDNTGMAFVLVQHLDPEHESLLSEILGRATTMSVNTAEDGVVVEANRVYVIPPGMTMTIAEGQLRLDTRAPQANSKVIDRFFSSLAFDQKNKAIAIILSGSNDDGVKGMREVRAAGGITFAQERTTAGFPEMPEAAVASGQVDFVLSPSQIAEELVKIGRHPYLREPQLTTEAEAAVFQENDLLKIYQLLKKHSGVDFSQYKQTTFERRLRRRMALHQLSQISEYTQYLGENLSEIEDLYYDALITVTSFFRDAEFFATLQETILPILLQQQSASSLIRIWVPGCSTGEEVYSIAICLLETLSTLTISPKIQIFGTDVSDRAIEFARNGIYRASQMENISPERQQRFFTDIDGRYQINKSVREICIFARQDLSSDPPFSELDLVSCRNVMIYFMPSLQQRVLSIFHYSLKSEGFLALGNSESVGDTSNLFEVFDAAAKVYAKRAVPTHLNFDFVTSYYPHNEASGRQGLSVALGRSNVQQWADQIVLNRYAPVGVIVNETLDILQFRGETSPYLRPPLGEPSFNLLKMLRPSLLLDVRTAIKQAQEQDIAVRRQNVLSEENEPDQVALEVIPFNVSQRRCFLVLFEQVMSPDAAEPSETRDLSPSDEEPASGGEVARLRRELALSRQELLDTQTYLRLTVEEQESTYQQLIAANEEILSSNEELKSTNEELQTAKEEIQSANEELKTTNEELQSRNTESRQANDDLLNLLSNVNIAILMLSDDLLIRSFTPAARSIFNLIPTDIGRPFDNIRPNFDIPDLEAEVRQVMTMLNTTEQEVQTRNGHWYLMRIRPYRTLDNHISGVVVALIDIDNLRRTEQDLRESQAQLQRELLAVNQMRSLSLQLFSSLDLDQALNELLDAALALLHGDWGNVYIYDPEQDALTLVAQQGAEPGFQACIVDAWSRDESAFGRSLKNGERVIVEDVATHPDFQPYLQYAESAGFRAMQSTPLISRNGQILGIISTYFQHPYQSLERELRILDIYARQASGFIELVQAEQERQQLQEQEQAARAANVMKDEFLSVLSHELRTPLNSILGWLQLIEHSNMSEQRRSQAIATVKKSAYAQLHLIEDLLNASHIIRDRLQIFPQPTNLTVLLQQAITSIQPQLTETGLQLSEEIESSREYLQVDPHRIEQVLCNLLSNAIKFTPSGRQITVGLSYLPTQVQIQVSDTGKGLEPKAQHYIFDRFRQADSSNTRKQGGLGLGLFIARSIVEAHDGTIEAHSAGRDQGTTFTIMLPKIEAEAEQPVAPTDSTQATSLEGVRVLIVEDHPDNVLLIQTVLKRDGATVSVANSGAEALNLVMSQPFDLLISDIGLPDMNGYDFMRHVRSLPSEQGGDIPAIALTGYVSPQDIQAALEAGFQSHLAKPFELAELIRVASAAIAPLS